MPEPDISKTTARKGCCVQGCIILAIIGLVLGGGLGWGMVQVINLFKNFTSETATVLPQFTPSAEAVSEVQQRITAFLARAKAQQAGGQSPGEQLRLTDTDLNTLISAAPGWDTFKGRLHFVIKDGRLDVSTAFPLTDLPVIGDRFLNGTLTLKPTVKKDRFSAGLSDFKVGGKPLPSYILVPLNSALNEALTQGQGDMGPFFQGIGAVFVEGNELVVAPKSEEP